MSAHTVTCITIIYQNQKTTDIQSPLCLVKTPARDYSYMYNDNIPEPENEYIDLDFDLFHTKVDALGHTPTPFRSL